MEWAGKYRGKHPDEGREISMSDYNPLSVGSVVRFGYRDDENRRLHEREREREGERKRSRALSRASR